MLAYLLPRSREFVLVDLAMTLAASPRDCSQAKACVQVIVKEQLMGGMRRFIESLGLGKRGKLHFCLFCRGRERWNGMSLHTLFSFQSFRVVCTAAIELANDLRELAWNKASVSEHVLSNEFSVTS